MSVYVSAHAWRHSSAGGSALLVLLALADQADDDGWCFPGVAYLARKCRLSERAVQDNLARLEAAGEVERHPRPGRSNYYRVVLAGGGADSAGVRPAAPGGCGTPHPGGAASRTHNHQGTTNEPPAGPDASDGALPGMPETADPEEGRTRWDAGVLVAAWVDGYRSSHDGADPLASVLRRVSGSAKQAARDVTDDGDRAAVLEVCRVAGAQVRYDVVQACADAASGRLSGGMQGRPVSLSPGSRNAAILARAAERAAGSGGGHDER